VLFLFAGLPIGRMIGALMAKSRTDEMCRYGL